MTQNRVCADRGLLVDGKTRLLTDPCEYYDERVRVLAGCCRLRCARCDAWVRGGPSGFGLKEGLRVDLAALHATQDWLKLPFVEPRQDVRLYACKCTWWEATRVDPIENDHDSPSDPNVPWSCAGHPLPTLPVVLDGLMISDASKWPNVVEKVLSGTCPRELQHADAIGAEPAIWLAWLYAYLLGLHAAEQLSSAIAARIDDNDPQIAGRALYFFWCFPHATGIERVVALAEADLHRIAIGYPVPEYHQAPTIWSVLVARLEHASKQPDACDTRVDALVRRALVVPLSSLPHDNRGPGDLVDFERKRRARQGWDPTSSSMNWYWDDYARLKQSERTDVIGSELARSPGAFDTPDMRQFIADHIVQIDAAAKGRWRQAMTLLTDWLRKPEEGHLIVIAGARIIQAGIASADELREWIEARRAYGWVDEAWVLPLKSMLEKN